MSTGPACVGVLREPAHSPGRVDDDAAIMQRVADALAERGFSVELVAADAMNEAPPANLFVMCERGTVLDRLAAMEKNGSVVVNAPAAIRNTYRHRMVDVEHLRQNHAIDWPAFVDQPFEIVPQASEGRGRRRDPLRRKRVETGRHVAPSVAAEPPDPPVRVHRRPERIVVIDIVGEAEHDRVLGRAQG